MPLTALNRRQIKDFTVLVDARASSVSHLNDIVDLVLNACVLQAVCAKKYLIPESLLTFRCQINVPFSLILSRSERQVFIHGIMIDRRRSCHILVMCFGKTLMDAVKVKRQLFCAAELVLVKYHGGVFRLDAFV